MITVEQLWSDKYAALHATAQAEEDERRAEDFLDVTRTVCGLEVRPLTPRDLLQLDYVRNPFVCGGDVTATSITQFLWQVCEPQPRGWWAERKFFRHCAALFAAKAQAEIQRYLDRTLADAPPKSTGAPEKPLGTSFVAPLIVRIAAGIPSMSPAAVMDTPLPQLFQLQKVLAMEGARKTGGKFRDRSTADRLLAECLEEANRLNSQTASQEAAERAETDPSAPSATSC
jgi:hypothetical protein